MRQAGGDRGLVGEARRRLEAARDAAGRSGPEGAPTKELEEAAGRVGSVEAWAAGCGEVEGALGKAREALAAGSRDEAAGHCRRARGVLDGGLARSEGLRAALQGLEDALIQGERGDLAGLAA